MILLTILLIVLLVIAAIVLLIAGLIGGVTLVCFGDIIVFVLAIALIIKLLKKKKRVP